LSYLLILKIINIGYYFTKIIEQDSIDQAIELLNSKLAEQGFGIISEIKVNEIFKNKLNKDFRPYRILGACHPEYAYKAISFENKIGTMLPCNFVVQELESGDIEISAVDPAASMSSVNNESLKDIAETVRNKIKTIVKNL